MEETYLTDGKSIKKTLHEGPVGWKILLRLHFENAICHMSFAQEYTADRDLGRDPWSRVSMKDIVSEFKSKA